MYYKLNKEDLAYLKNYDASKFLGRLLRQILLFFRV